MRCAAAILILLASILVPTSEAGSKAPPKPAPFASAEDLQHWIKNYRLAPRPERLPAAVKAMSRLGLFQEIDSAGIYFGFAAGVIGANPKLAEKLIGAMFPMPPEDQVMIVRAIAWSGLPQWRTIMTRFVEKMPARRVLIERHLYGKLPDLMALPADQNPAAIDALWGYYYGSGDTRPIGRLIEILAWSTDRDDVDKLTAGSMVKLTLATNATRDLDLLALLKREAQRQTKATARPLADVIEAAETYETGRLRKNALAAIADVKQKGGASKRNVSFWGQVGTTALALGCVAASALGQVQLGLPCIVGGATATAALRVFTLEK